MLSFITGPMRFIMLVNRTATRTNAIDQTTVSDLQVANLNRSEERRVGKYCLSPIQALHESYSQQDKRKGARQQSARWSLRVGMVTFASCVSLCYACLSHLCGRGLPELQTQARHW